MSNKPEHSILESTLFNPTPQMKAWRDDAEEFGIPFQVQKGLMFLIAFGMRASYQAESIEDWLDFTRKLSKKIRKKQPHIRTEDGGNFYDENFSPLLTEFADRLVGNEFSPRVIPYPSGNGSFSVWDRENKGDQLPECLRHGIPPSPLLPMADMDEVVTSLCDQIGDGIHMNLEGAYLAGFLYFDSQYYYDRACTYQIASLIAGMLPPKYSWFRHGLNFSASQMRAGNPMQKVLDCFLGPIAHEMPYLYRLVTYLSDQLHYEAAGKKRQHVWDATLQEFTFIVISQRNWFNHEEEPARSSIIELRKSILDTGFESPPACSSHQEAMATVAERISGRWGYRIFDTEESLTPSDIWIRRACILYLTTIYSVIDTSWNDF
jgi:hypothetical protein